MEEPVIDDPAPSDPTPPEPLTPVPAVEAEPDSPAESSDPLTARPWKPEARVQRRTRVYGRASLTLSGGVVRSGSVYDLTPQGISVVLDYRLAMGKAYTLDLNIYRNGRLHQLSLKVHSIHETLVGCLGFKHGFEFDASSDEISQILGEVLA